MSTPKPDPLLDLYARGHRLTAALEAERYARAIYEGYRDGSQYEHRPNLQLYYQQWQEAREKHERIERELADQESYGA